MFTAGPRALQAGADSRLSTAGAGTASWAARSGVVVVFALEALLLAALTQGEVTQAGNDASRWATVERLVEAGTFSIDGASFQTVDRVRIGDRFYSDKPPLLSCWMAALYAPLHWVGGLSFRSDARLLLWTLVVVGIGTLSLLLSVGFYLRLRQEGAGRGMALLLGVAVVATTWILSYGTTLNNHTPAALLGFGLYWLVERCRSTAGGGLAVIAGLTAGTLLGLEIPTGLALFAAGAAALLAGRPLRWRRAAQYSGAFTVVALLLGALNLAAHGSVLPAYMVPGAYDFLGNIHTRALAGLHTPSDVTAYLGAITFGGRGLFSHMPVLALGVGFLWVARRRLPATDLSFALAVLALVLFYGTRTGDLGGWAYGFRFLIPIVPLLFWWASRLVTSVDRSGAAWLDPRPRRALVGGLLAVGLLTSLAGATNPWPVAYEDAASHPRAVEQQVRAPFFANLLVWSFVNDQEWLLEPLAQRLYGRKLAVEYLAVSLQNLERTDLLPRLRALALRWRVLPG